MTATRRTRARPLAPAERREVLVDATLRLLREHGRQITTRQIAEQAGVAEGTIFRVFDTKEELIDEAIRAAFQPGEVSIRLAEIPRDLPQRDRLIAGVSVLQQRFRATFDLMGKVGLVRPPEHIHDSPEVEAWRARLVEHLLELVGDDVPLRVPPGHVVHLLRLLTFSGSHPHVSDGHFLTPAEIVDCVLDGVRAPAAGGE